MPPLKKVKNLQDLCFKLVGDILFKITLDAENITSSNVSEVIHFLKCFLPGQILYNVCNDLVERCENANGQKWITGCYFQIIEGLHSQSIYLEGLDIIDPFIESFDGKNLKSVVLRGSFYTGADEIVPMYDSDTELYYSKYLKLFKCIKSLHNLVKFSSDQMCNNQMLKIISSTCVFLEEINIEICSQVDDEGISYLCGFKTFNFNDRNKYKHDYCAQKKTSPCCQSLKKIHFEYTMITNAGAALLLHCCPNIEDIHIVPDINIGEVFSLLHGSDIEKLGQLKKSYNLKTLFSCTPTIDAQDLDLISSTCPHIEEITLRCCGVERTDKNILVNLLKLSITKLSVINCNMEALLWVFNTIGLKLKSLRIQHLITAPPNLQFDRSHLQKLIVLCPNLINFSLMLSKSNSIQPNVPYSYFKDLKLFSSLVNLKIEGAVLIERDLSIFLSKCSNLKSLHLECHNLEVIDDLFLYNLLSDNILCNLETLYLYRPLLTMSGLQRLIANCPNLHTIGPLSSWAISSKDRESLASSIKTGNWDLNVDGFEKFNI